MTGSHEGYSVIYSIIKTDVDINVCQKKVNFSVKLSTPKRDPV